MLITCRIFKEKVEKSPGIILVGHGDKNTTPNREVSDWLVANNWSLIFTNVGLTENRVGWLGFECCLGGTILERGIFEHAKPTILKAGRFLLCNGHQDGLSYRALSAPPRVRGRTNLSFGHLERRFDICDITTVAPRKRQELFISACRAGNLTGYLFISGYWSVAEVRQRVELACAANGFIMERFRYPASTLDCLRSTDGQLFIDTRPWDENAGTVANVLDSSKVWLHLSNIEGLPESLREAACRDVPVIIASDLRSPIMGANRTILFGGKFRLGEITDPDVPSIVATVRKVLDNPGNYQPRLALSASGFDPFEFNRDLTVACQQSFEQRGWPWKGVSLGLTSGSPSDIDLARPIPAEVLHRGFGAVLWEATDYGPDYLAAFPSS